MACSEHIFLTKQNRLFAYYFKRNMHHFKSSLSHTQKEERSKCHHEKSGVMFGFDLLQSQKTF